MPKTKNKEMVDYAEPIAYYLASEELYNARDDMLKIGEQVNRRLLKKGLPGKRNVNKDRVKKRFFTDPAVGKVLELVSKHGDHNQEDHGNWADQAGHEIGTAGEAVGSLPDLARDLPGMRGDKISPGELAHESQLRRRIHSSEDSFHHGLASLIDAYTEGDLDAKGFAELSDAWGREFKKAAAIREGEEVARALGAMDIVASIPKDEKKRESFQAKNAILQDVIQLFGQDRVQSAFDVVRGTFGTGGDVSKEDQMKMIGGQKAFGGGANIGTADARRNVLVDWINERRAAGEGSSLKARLGKIRGSNIGAIFDDKGRIEQVSRPNVKGDEFLPFGIIDTFKMRDKHVVRGRGQGGLTDSDLFMTLLAPPKSITVTSGSGTQTIEFNTQYRNSLGYRWDVWKAFRGIQKDIEKHNEKSGEIISASPAGILGVIQEDFPNAFGLERQAIEAPEEPGEVPFEDRLRDLASFARDKGLLTLDDERIFRGDEEFDEQARTKLRELEAAERFFGQRFSDEQKEAIANFHKQQAKMDTLLGMIQESVFPSTERRARATSGRVREASERGIAQAAEGAERSAAERIQEQFRRSDKSRVQFLADTVENNPQLQESEAIDRMLQSMDQEEQDEFFAILQSKGVLG